VFTARYGLGLYIYFRLILAIDVFLLSVTFIFIYILHLQEGQRGEAWGPSKEQCAFGNEVTLYRKSILFDLYRVEMVSEKEFLVQAS